MDDFRHAGEVYNFLEQMLKHYTRDEDAEAMCKGLHDLGFWVSLPHEVIERAYQDRNIPDRYCTVALMAENRFLIQANEKLAAREFALLGGGGFGPSHFVLSFFAFPKFASLPLAFFPRLSLSLFLSLMHTH